MSIGGLMVLEQWISRLLLRNSSAAWTWIATWQSWAALHKRSSASEKLVFKIQVIWSLQAQMDGFLFFFSPPCSICQITNECCWMHDAGNKALRCSLYQSDIQGSESIVILWSLLNSLHHWAMTFAWGQYGLTIITANNALLHLDYA